MQKTFFLLLISFATIFSVEVKAQNLVILKNHFDLANIPTIPDYTRTETWAALPSKEDAADKIPLKSNLTDKQSEAKADVFYILLLLLTSQKVSMSGMLI
jgi:hypothetical protein